MRKPDSSRWWIWIASTVILIGLYTGIIATGETAISEIGVVYTIVWGVLSALYFVGRMVSKRLLEAGLAAVTKLGGGNVG